MSRLVMRSLGGYEFRKNDGVIYQYQNGQKEGVWDIDQNAFVSLNGEEVYIPQGGLKELNSFIKNNGMNNISYLEPTNLAEIKQEVDRGYHNPFNVMDMTDAYLAERLHYIYTNYKELSLHEEELDTEIEMLEVEHTRRGHSLQQNDCETDYLNAIRRNQASSLDSMVKTNHGEIPLIDYLDIRASQYGFDTYEELLDEGMSIEPYSYVTKEVIQDWKNMKAVDESIDRVMEQMELQAMEPELGLEL